MIDATAIIALLPTKIFTGGQIMKLINRCIRFLETLGIPTTVFCRNVKISPTAFYSWKNGNLTLSDSTLERIEDYIGKYGF